MTPTEYGEVCDGCGKLLICRSCGKFRTPTPAQPEQEPVAWRYTCADGSIVLMLKRLTDEQKRRGYYTSEDGEDEVDDDEAVVGPFHWAEETPLYAAQPPAAPVENTDHIDWDAMAEERLGQRPPGSSADTSELLPCPFCGGEPSWTGDYETKLGNVSCENSDCFGPRTTAARYDDAAVQWNTRAQPQPAPLTKEVVLDWLSKNTLYFSARWPLSRPHGESNASFPAGSAPAQRLPE